MTPELLWVLAYIYMGHPGYADGTHGLNAGRFPTEAVCNEQAVRLTAMKDHPTRDTLPPEAVRNDYYQCEKIEQ